MKKSCKQSHAVLRYDVLKNGESVYNKTTYTVSILFPGVPCRKVFALSLTLYVTVGKGGSMMNDIIRREKNKKQ